MHFKGLVCVFREPHRRLTGAHSSLRPLRTRDCGHCGLRSVADAAPEKHKLQAFKCISNRLCIFNFLNISLLG